MHFPLFCGSSAKFVKKKREREEIGWFLTESYPALYVPVANVGCLHMTSLTCIISTV